MLSTSVHCEFIFVLSFLSVAISKNWNGKHPVVKLVTKTYELGAKLTIEVMSTIEKQIKRLTYSSHETFPDLGK
ncbi:hypothetical protein [Nostoc sp.]|uniref:hypothetical protein n=1 Tax=Nostoc sp. TaxID=1180 RepID=UPI002FF97CE2